MFALQTLKQQPYSTLILMALTLCVTLWSFTSFNLWQQQSKILQDQLAREITQAASLSLSTAMLTNDRASLQAILSALVKDSIIVKASIHDVEQQLLAQAGNPAHFDSDNYSTPITLQDTIAGFLTIELGNPQASINRYHRHRWIILTFLMITCAIGLILTRARQQQGQNQNLSQHQAAFKQAEENQNHSELNPSANNEDETEEQLELLIYCRNLGDLQQQLDQRSLQLLLDKLEEWLQHSRQLYQCRDYHFQKDTFSLRLNNDAFAALCCAQLLFTFTRSFSQRWLPGVNLQLGALLRPAGGSLNEQRYAAAQLIQIPSQTVAVSESLELDERVNYQRNDQGMAFVTGLASRYTELLASQTQQINNAM